MYIIDRTYLPRSKNEFLEFFFQHREILEYRYFVKVSLKSLAKVIFIENIPKLISSKSAQVYFETKNPLTEGLNQIIKNSRWKHFPQDQVNFYPAARLKQIEKNVQEQRN